ncbi:MAG: tetratricopeptide repeat protein [Acidobacteriota bacterium]|nr:tetratricopeptide repeat protein [Acidobacteriota bacterium]MDE3170038.1 tetratricopeptide repeat protein [Acidobacteriota bacterium]
MAALLIVVLSPARGGARGGNAVDVSGLVDAARQQFEQGQYGAAVATLQSAQSQNPASAEIYYWMGRALFEIHEYDAAITQFQKAISLSANVSMYHQWLGRAYGSKADRDKSFFVARNAKGQFEAAVKLDPANVAARRDLADYCMQAPWIVGGNKDEALAQVNAISAINAAAGHLARAEYDLNVLKNSQKADSEYREVLAEQPPEAEAYLETAAFFAAQKELPELKSAIDGMEKLYLGDPRVTFYRGVYGVLSNAQFDNAEEELKSYLARTPDRSDWPSHSLARDWLGRLYEQQGKALQAAEQYRAALQLNPENQDARVRLQRLEKAVR